MLAVKLLSGKATEPHKWQVNILVQAIAWCCPGNKPLPEPMLTQVYVDTSLGRNEFKSKLKREDVAYKYEICIRGPWHQFYKRCLNLYIEGLAQGCNNSSELAMELLQSCTKPLIWHLFFQLALLYLWFEWSSQVTKWNAQWHVVRGVQFWPGEYYKNDYSLSNVTVIKTWTL